MKTKATPGGASGDVRLDGDGRGGPVGAEVLHRHSESLGGVLDAGGQDDRPVLAALDEDVAAPGGRQAT